MACQGSPLGAGARATAQGATSGHPREVLRLTLSPGPRVGTGCLHRKTRVVSVGTGEQHQGRSKGSSTSVLSPGPGRAHRGGWEGTAGDGAGDSTSAPSSPSVAQPHMGCSADPAPWPWPPPWWTWSLRLTGWGRGLGLALSSVQEGRWEAALRAGAPTQPEAVGLRPEPSLQVSFSIPLS